ncbi:hypothetical protein BR93DRAFT_979643 [Coniochaeta sp. PMI_546]|nr:hypothetical protein BR93DRAFT_979643 [Coniochaeta sp. PMI_546]
MSYYHCDDSGKSWNLYAVLQFVNPELGYRTCIGTAVTYGRRCRRTISSSLFNLTQLGAQTPLAAANSSKLYDLARSGLCWQHQHQTSEVVARWRGLLYKYAEAQSDNAQPSSRCHSPDPATAGSRHKPWAQEAEPSVEDLMEQIRLLQKKLEAMMRSQQKRSPRSTAGSTASSCKFEEQTKEQEHTDERRQREEREAQAREARKREENERAERARTRRQREQEREQREWSDA